VPLKPGDIVIANIPDPNGDPIDHCHPAMVLRANAQIAYLVAISTKFSRPTPKHWLELPLNANTNLREPCVLKCHWVTTPIDVARCNKIGEVPTDILDLATDWVLALVEQKKAANQPPSGAS